MFVRRKYIRRTPTVQNILVRNWTWPFGWATAGILDVIGFKP